MGFWVYVWFISERTAGSFMSVIQVYIFLSVIQVIHERNSGVFLSIIQVYFWAYFRCISERQKMLAFNSLAFVGAGRHNLSFTRIVFWIEKVSRKRTSKKGKRTSKKGFQDEEWRKSRQRKDFLLSYPLQILQSFFFSIVFFKLQTTSYSQTTKSFSTFSITAAFWRTWVTRN